MKNMKSVAEYYQAPPPGRYLSQIIEATAGLSGKGETMITLKLSILDERYKGTQCNDWIVTDGTNKGARGFKAKLRGLGVFEMVAETDDDVPDSEICRRLLGMQIYVDYGNEQRKGKDGNGDYTVDQFANDPNGNRIALMNLRVEGYSKHPVGGATQAATQAAVATQTVQAPVQGIQQPIPQQVLQAPVQQPIQQQLPIQGQQFVGQVPQQFIQQPVQGQVVPQFAAPNQQFNQAPIGYAPGMAPQQFQTVAAPPPWTNGGQAVQPPAPDEGGKSKRRKLQVDTGTEG